MAACISDKVTFQRLWVQIEEVETLEDYYGMWNEICTQEDEYNSITAQERATLHACLDAVAALRRSIRKMEIWKIEYTYYNDLFEGALDYECCYYKADTAQQAVDKCRKQFKPRHKLEIQNVYQICVKTNDWT